MCRVFVCIRIVVMMLWFVFFCVLMIEVCVGMDVLVCSLVILVVRLIILRRLLMFFFLIVEIGIMMVLLF